MTRKITHKPAQIQSHEEGQIQQNEKYGISLSSIQKKEITKQQVAVYHSSVVNGITQT